MTSPAAKVGVKALGAGADANDDSACLTIRITLHSLSAVVIVGSFALVSGPYPPETDKPQVLSEIAESTTAVDEFYQVWAMRSFAKDLVASEAVEGRWSLVEAAALFRELDRVPPALPPPSLWPPYDSCLTNEEAYCRQVIARSTPLPCHHVPAGTNEALSRLETELAEMRRHGFFRLPNPGSTETVAALLARTKASLTETQRRAIRPPLWK